MTIMTAMEGITAPRRPAPITETYLPDPDDAFDDAPLTPSRRADGWSAGNQRSFLEALAEGHGVEAASLRVGLSAASAYAFRRTAKGAAFALGWRAASLVARDAIAETLLVRALEGTVDTIVRGETVITRHKFDNRLALSLLARLDRQAETAPDADIKAARLVAQEFDAFLDLVAKDEGPARAGLFLARRSGGEGDDARDLSPVLALAAADRFLRTGAATADEIDVSDLDPAHRQDWSAEQWARAEAAGLLTLAPAPTPEKNTLSSQHSQHSARSAEQQGWSASRNEPGRPCDPHGPTAWLGHDVPACQEPVWWCGDAEEFRTWFPPPDDFDGDEDGEYGDLDYNRALTDAEFEILAARDIHPPTDTQRAEQEAERDAWFALAPAEPAAEAAATPPPEPEDADPADDPDDADAMATIIAEVATGRIPSAASQTRRGAPKSPEPAQPQTVT